MLFTYQYIEHDIEKLQEYLDFLFNEVWLTAVGEFEADKLDGNPYLKQIYIDFGNIDYDPSSAKKNEKGKSAYFFNSSIERIYDEFSSIDDDVFKEELREYYVANNNIESLCSDKTKLPISYADIKGKYPELEKLLSNFYKKLYGSESPFNLDAFGQLTKKLLPSHYEDFMEINDDEICPFCGILPIKGNNHSYREAYDHYLPKGLYPFNALNFKNLVPMCHECNSTYKLTEDPIYEDYKKIDPLKKEEYRQLAFYPYSNNHPQIDIEIDLKSSDIDNLEPDDIDIKLESNGHDEQIESWKRVFGIEERYLAILCAKHGGKEWFADVYDHFENAKVLSDIQKADEYYHKVIRATTRNDCDAEMILKRKFLEKCRSNGLLPGIESLKDKKGCLSVLTFGLS
ncbi:MAG: hypothetical protein MI700_10010 [Balneolales bacterium]|nr:hypothetical protein [Balneolales bacterium]